MKCKQNRHTVQNIILLKSHRKKIPFCALERFEQRSINECVLQKLNLRTSKYHRIDRYVLLEM